MPRSGRLDGRGNIAHSGRSARGLVTLSAGGSHDFDLTPARRRPAEKRQVKSCSATQAAIRRRHLRGVALLGTRQRRPALVGHRGCVVQCRHEVGARHAVPEQRFGQVVLAFRGHDDLLYSHDRRSTVFTPELPPIRAATRGTRTTARVPVVGHNEPRSHCRWALEKRKVQELALTLWSRVGPSAMFALAPWRSLAYVAEI